MEIAKKIEVSFWGNNPERSNAFGGWAVCDVEVDFRVDPEDQGAVVSFILKVARKSIENGFSAALTFASQYALPSGLADRVRNAVVMDALEAARTLALADETGWTDFTASTKREQEEHHVQRQFMQGPFVFASMEVPE